MFLGFTETQFIIRGDMNIDYTSNCKYANDLQDIVASCAASNKITQFTRITEISATMLDIFITILSDTNITTGVFTCDTSNHLPSFCSISTQKET